MIQVTPDQLADEAARMALELRFAQRANRELTAEVERLRKELKERDGDGEDAPPEP